MEKSPKLTKRQQQILDFILQTIERTGSPPTRAEISTAFGFRSANAAEEHLKALARKGVIDLLSGTSRGIRLNAETLRSIHQTRLRNLGGGPAGRSALLANRALMLPLVGRVAAGNPILAQEHIERTFSVESHLFARKPDYLLKVRGMSMRDAGILDGDLLAVEKSSEAKSGQIVVARLGDEVTVKRFRRTTTGVELVPENPEFNIIHVPSGSIEFSLEGLAVGLIRNTMLV